MEVKCPHCRSVVDPEATKCPHCGSDLWASVLWRTARQHPWWSSVITAAAIGAFVVLSEEVASAEASQIDETCANAEATMGALSTGEKVAFFSCAEEPETLCDAWLNPDLDGGFGRGEVRLPLRAAQYVDLGEFAKEDGERFDPARHELRKVLVRCPTQDGEYSDHELLF
jgi:hypothetical protein